MKRSDLQDWLIFSQVVESRGFSAAGKKLKLSPSVVSKHIHQLERQLGARLLQRTTRSLGLTDAGQLFYTHCQRIKIEITQALHAVKQNQEQPGGLLRVHAPMSFGQLHLSPVLAEFLHRYPDIQIELLLGGYLPNLIEQNIDVAISISDLPDSTLIAKCIAKRGTGIYASPAYFKQQGIPLHPDDLKTHNCLVYHSHGTKNYWRFYQPPKKSFIVKVKGNFRANSTQALARAAIAGLGIAKLPIFMVTEEVRQKRLVQILTDYCHETTGIYAVYPHRDFLEKRVQLFIDFLGTHAAMRAGWQ